MEHVVTSVSDSSHPSPPIARRDLHPALNTIVFHNLSPVSAGLCFLYGFLAVSHLLVLTGNVAYLMSAIAVATAVAMATLYFMLKRNRLPVGYAHRIGAAVILAVTVNSLLHLLLTAQLQQTTNLILTVIGAALLLLSTPWFLVSLGVILISWWVSAWPELGTPLWTHFAYGMFSATLLAVVVHLTQVRTFRRFETLRLQSESQAKALEVVLRTARENEEKFRLLSEATFEGIAIHTNERVLDCNQQLADLFGYARDDILGKSPLELTAPESRELIRERIRAGYEHTYEIVGLHRSGSTFPIEVRGKTIQPAGQTIRVTILRDVTERKRVEQALRESEERYRSIVAALDEGIVLHGETGAILACNASAERILGLTADQIMGRTSTDPDWRTVHEDGSPFPGEEHPAMLTLHTGQPQANVRMGVHKPEGDLTWISINSQPIVRSGETKPYAVVVSFTDITQSKAAEKAMRESEQRYRLLFDNSIDAVLLTSPDGRILNANAEAQRIFGRSEAELRALGRGGVIDTGDPRLVPALAERARTGKFSGVLNFRRADGSTFPGEISSALFQDKDGDSRTSMIIRDITERQRMEEQLRLNSAAMESAANMIIITDPHGLITWVNPAFTRQTGYTATQAAGRQLGTLRTGDSDPTFYNGIWDTLRTGHVWQGEITYQRQDGSLYVEENVFTPVYDGNGQITHFIAIAQDITARRQAEEEILNYSDRLEEKVDERTQELRQAQARLLTQQRLEQEVKLAAEVQNSLLPRQVPQVAGYEFAARASPARYISGDLYDFVPVDADTWHIAVADIAGKGIPAALLTSTARALLRVETERECSPAAILANLNRALYTDLGQAEMFITMLAARLDARQGRVTYANAGHAEAIWCQIAAGTYQMFSATGLPLGIQDPLDIREENILLRPGDQLVFYSDGVTEAINPQDELFGVQRLKLVLSENGGRSADELAQAILQAVTAFAAGAAQSDDLTLIVLKALPRTVDFRHPARLDQLDALVATVRQACLAYGEEPAYELELIASELATNIIQHAYRDSAGEVRGQLHLEAERICLDLYDDGVPFNLDSLPPPDLDRPHEGGYGLFITRQLASELAYTPNTSKGNHWHVVKNLQANRP